ncbi:hypothetical protein Ancab_026618 [Ancistrocladus abbreviatus]
MGKRNSVVVLSSDDDEEAVKRSSRSSNLKYSKSKFALSSKTPTPRRPKDKAPKKARLSDSCLATSDERKEFDELKLLYEDIADDFSGFKVSAVPRNFEELAVHKKKVEEVKLWLEERLRTPKKEIHNYVLLITGPAGVGKSVCSHSTHVNAFASYNFMSNKSSHVHLSLILISDYGRAGSDDSYNRYLEELALSLESAGACKVAFNPITVSSIKKTLSRICRLEQYNVTSEQIELIANASGGDVRHAITSLQYFCLKPGLMITGSSTKYHPIDLEVKSHDLGYSLPFGRDQTLALFHALGKFLHNKRETKNAAVFTEDEFPLKEGLIRLPLKMDIPEKVLCQAYGQARPVVEFLHENILDFLGEEATEDAWAVTSYLSDADYLLSSNHRVVAKSYEVENVAQSVAASVAVRGVLFGNAHPSPSRWHTIRRPKVWNVEQSVCRNMYELKRQRGSLCYEVQHGSTRAGMLEEGEFDCMNSANEESQATDDEIEDCDVLKSVHKRGPDIPGVVFSCTLTASPRPLSYSLFLPLSSYSNSRDSHRHNSLSGSKLSFLSCWVAF